VTATIGLVGCGRWGRLILRDLRELGARVQVVVKDPGRAEELLAAGAVGVHCSPAEIPEPVDGFVVATPIETHGAVIDELLASQRPIFVEKPLTDSVSAARRIVRDAGERVFVMDKWRYHPAIIALREHIRSGALGRIRAVKTYRLSWGIAHENTDPTWVLLPHDLAIAFELLAFLPEAQFAARLFGNAETTDLIAVFGGPEDGPVVISEVSGSQPVKRRSVTVIGELGAAEFVGDDEARVHLVGAPGGEVRSLAVPNEMPLLAELRTFLAYLSGGPAPKSSAAEGLLVVERIASVRALAGLPA
jgi:predicted dehydrogenase